MSHAMLRFDFVDGTTEVVRHESRRYRELIEDGHTPVGSVPASDGISDQLQAYLDTRFGAAVDTTDAAVDNVLADAGSASAQRLAGSYVGKGGEVYDHDYATLADAVAALTPNAVLYLDPEATYTIAATVQPTVDDVVIDGRGAKVRLDASPTGEAAASDRIFYLTGTNQRISNVSFVARAGGSNAADSIAANVRIDGTGNRVTDCRFSTGSNQAVFVGTGSDHHVSRNYVTGGSGIIYAWGSVKRTSCVGNTLIGSTGVTYGALEGVGNGGGGAFVEDCLVADNMVVNAASIAIQDQQNTRGTIIRGNHCINPGSMGISAVGYGTVIQGNRVEDPSNTAYGIEAFANGATVTGNRVSYRTKTPTTGAGIMVSEGAIGVTVSGNIVEGASYGIQTASGTAAAAITGNAIINPIARGIYPQSNEPATISGNTIRFSVPASNARYGITPAAAGTMVSGNVFMYTSGSAGGAFQDYAVTLNAASMGVVGNTVSGGGRADTYRPKVAATLSTANVLISSNIVRNGAILDSSTSLTTPVVANNVTT